LAPPIPTPADPLPKLQVPDGFKVEVFQPGLLDARALRRGDKGTIFVSSLFVAGKVYAIVEKGRSPDDALRALMLRDPKPEEWS